ncbi:MAG: HAD hydrolase-like protein [Acutalibacteraceae bacterium]
MHFHTVLFDFDYTLADTSVGIVNSFHYEFDRLNIERKEEASIKKTIGMPLKAAFTALTGLQDPRLQEQFRRYFVTSSNAIMTKNTVLLTTPLLC